MDKGLGISQELEEAQDRKIHPHRRYPEIKTLYMKTICKKKKTSPENFLQGHRETNVSYRYRTLGY